MKMGSYSQLHPGTKLRIIGLNTLVYDMMNSYLWKNATNPLGVVRFPNVFSLLLAHMAGRNVGSKRKGWRIRFDPDAYSYEQSIRY